MSRRLCVLVLLLPALLLPLAADEPARKHKPLTLTVSEEAGIRRFGYPVSVPLPERLFHKDARFRLLDNGKPVPAQFRWFYPGRDEKERFVSVDFTVSLGPLESRTYTLERGPDVEPGPEPTGGMKVEMKAEEIVVRHLPGMEFTVPRNLLGLLRQVRVGKTEYLRPGSPGLWIRYKDQIDFRAGGAGPDGAPTVARVVREGPLSSVLRFDGTEALRGGRSVASQVWMEFPRSKSWVRIGWFVDDPNGYVASLGAELNLNVPGAPTLVDFGAGTSVYAELPKGQSAVLRSRWVEDRGSERITTWETLLGPGESLRPYVVAPKPASSRPPGIPALMGRDSNRAEGWAHVMDRERCTAVAVENFALPRTQLGIWSDAEGKTHMGRFAGAVEEEIQIDADGRLQIGRTFARAGEPVPPGPKTLVFFLHFVGMPVHVGARTSPQAMLAPLQVQVRE